VKREAKWTLKQELALTRAHSYFVRVDGETCITKVVFSCILLSYMLAIISVIDDMTMC
jgi:hypothetical protein